MTQDFGHPWFANDLSDRILAIVREGLRTPGRRKKVEGPDGADSATDRQMALDLQFPTRSTTTDSSAR